MLLRMLTTEISVDRFALNDLENRLRSRLQSPELLRDVFRPASESVRDVLREMSNCDFIVTSKYHGIIFSHLLKKPAISLSYHKKMDVAMEAVGQSRFNADVERFDFDWLTTSFRTLVAESRNIKLETAASSGRECRCIIAAVR